MNDIDFLPITYREATIERQNVTLRVLVVAAFALAIGAAAAYQQWLRVRTSRELAAIDAPYQQVVGLQAQLQQMQGQLRQAEEQAELWAYLQHPWPRSRILDALCAPLPASVRIERIDFEHEQMPRPPRPPEVGAASKQAQATPPPTTAAQRDLAKLRQRCDTKRPVVVLTGIADDAAALHEYIARLANQSIFLKVNLASVEKMADDQHDRMRFSARGTVRPGYLQPDGPLPDATAQTGR